MKNIFYAALFIFPLIAVGQKEASTWYFGQGSGLNFNTEPPTVLSDSKLFTFEGCATISDKNGQLLFYTDGITVYDKSHEEMQNGLDLLGDPSSSQSAIIVPKPEDENIYYIFTVGAEFPGLRYSVVDMTLNGGNGDIVPDQKNIMLLPGAYEKITAVKHLDGSSIWVISFDGGTFHAYRVSTNGIDRQSVRSPLGEFIADPRGYLKASPNGEYIAMANYASNSYLLSFFAASGRIFPGTKFDFINPGEQAYGVEFSAKNQKLYVDTHLQEITDNPNIAKNVRFLYQFDLSGRDVQSTRVLIDTQDDTFRGALQLAVNGKIYRALSSQYEAGSKYLGVINNPELDGALSDYQHNAIDLSPLNFRLNLSTQGLPPFIQSLFFFSVNVKNPCALQEAEFSLNTIEDNYTVVWDFGDGTFSNEQNPTHQYPSAGFYSVTATMTLATGETKTIEKKVQIFDVPLPNPLLEQCDNDNDGLANFNLDQLYDPLTRWDEISTLEFFESFDDIDNNIMIDASVPYTNITNPQQLWVRSTTKFGCELIIPFTIRAVNAKLGPIESIVVCDSNDGIEDDSNGLFDLVDKESSIRNQFSLDPSISINFYSTESDAEFEINPIEKEDLISQTKTIWVRAESDTQSCIGIEPISLIVNTLPPSLDEKYFICLNKPNTPLTLNANPQFDTYEWVNLDTNNMFDTNQFITIFDPGNYSLTSYITRNGIQCSRTELFSVEPSNIASFQQIDVIDLSENNSITVLVSGEGSYEYRLLDENNAIYAPYQESNVFEQVPPGLYTVTVKDVKNNCGTVDEQVSVIGFPKFFTPNNDGVHDTWQVYGISGTFQSNSKILIYNRYGKLLKQLSPLEEGWDGMFNGAKLPSDDYWFSVTLQDGRIFKSHFTLKY